MSNSGESTPFTTPPEMNAPEMETEKKAETKQAPDVETAPDAPEQKQSYWRPFTPPPYQSAYTGYRYSPEPDAPHSAGPQPHQQPPFRNGPYTPPEWDWHSHSSFDNHSPEFSFRKKPLSPLKRFFSGKKGKFGKKFHSSSILDQLMEKLWFRVLIALIFTALIILLLSLTPRRAPLPEDEKANTPDAAQPQIQQQLPAALTQGTMGVYTYDQLKALMESNPQALENGYFLVISPEKEAP